MAACDINKIDSNATGTAWSEEMCLGIPYIQSDNKTTWKPVEANSYPDFGADVSVTARQPINSTRQNQFGVVTDLAAVAGWNQDFTLPNSEKLMQGFLFADARQKPVTMPMNYPIVASTPITGVTGSSKTIAVTSPGGTPFKANMLVNLTGFTNSGNNGIKTVTASTATTIVTAEALVDEAAPPSTAKAQVVGATFAAADVNLTMAGNIPSLTTTAGDFTTLGLIAGEWIYIGDDTATNRFANNGGFARIAVNGIAAKTLTFDKTTWTPVAETGTGKTIRFYMGTVIRNENTPSLIKQRSYTIERQLGNDSSGLPQSQLVMGCVPNQLTLNIPGQDKLNADFTFVGTDQQTRTGADGLMYGTRETLASADAFNTSSDVNRISLTTVDATTSTPAKVFSFITTMTLTVNNNVSAAKAVGKLGAIGMNVGNIDVGGSITAYFQDTTGPAAVRNNQRCALDIQFVKNNQGMLIDVPLLSLGNGRLQVQKDNPVTMPLDTNGAQSPFGNTITFQVFPYLPTAADTNL
jgi:hypothetical protein